MQFLTPKVGWARAAHCFGTFCSFNNLARTLDGGATWQDVLTLDSYGWLNPFYAFNDKSAVVARVGLKAPNSWWDRGVMRTDDGGASWSAVAQGERESTKVLTAWDANHGIRVSESIRPSADEVMWTADNRTWQDAEMPVTSGYSLDFIDTNSGWTAGSEVLHTGDGGLTWESMSDMRFGSVDFVSQDEGWATQYGCNTVNTLCGQFVFRTKDGGASWQQLNSEVNGIFETKFFDSNCGWGDQGPTSSSQIMHTDDGGLNWKGAAHMTGMFPAYVDSNVAWVANPPYFGLSAAQSSSTWPDKMYVELTSDGGATMRSNSFEAPGFCGNLAIAATDASNAWLIWKKCDGDQATLEVQRTTDGNASWQGCRRCRSTISSMRSSSTPCVASLRASSVIRINARRCSCARATAAQPGPRSRQASSRSVRRTCFIGYLRSSTTSSTLSTSGEWVGEVLRTFRRSTATTPVLHRRVPLSCRLPT